MDTVQITPAQFDIPPPALTPESRARKAFHDAQIGKHWGREEDVVKFVAQAIADAVKAERTACARIAREIAAEYVRASLLLLAVVADRVNVEIMGRE